jgi:hypothetical protein
MSASAGVVIHLSYQETVECSNTRWRICRKRRIGSISDGSYAFLSIDVIDLGNETAQRGYTDLRLQQKRIHQDSKFFTLIKIKLSTDTVLESTSPTCLNFVLSFHSNLVIRINQNVNVYFI